MKIVEQFIQSRTPNAEDCEDGIFVNNHFVAVVDGATSKSGTKWNGKKSGKIAVELILSRLGELSADSGASLAMSELNKAIADWCKEKGVYEQLRDNPIERCVASVVIFSRAKNQIWFVGDCQALVDGDLFTNNKLIDDITSSTRALFIESALLEGKTIADLQEHDSGRDFIFPLLEKQNLFQNIKKDSEFKYEVLDGFFEDASTIKIIDVPKDAKEIVLASDGYPVLASTLAESESVLKEILAEDPLLFRRYKSTKGLQTGSLSYDDRSYIRFSR
jgi:glycerophosphoryl diester phosphodiesterase